MGEILLNGKRAVKVNAKSVLWGSKAVGAKAKLYDIDGDKKWVPISLSKFTADENYSNEGDIPGKLLIEEWFYNKILFPNG